MFYSLYSLLIPRQVRDIADNCHDKKLAPILTKACENAEEWMHANAESASTDDLRKKIKEMERRLHHASDA